MPVALPPGRLRLATKPSLNRVQSVNEDNGRRYGRRLGGQSRRRTPGRSDHCHVTTNQIGGKLRQSIVFSFRPAIVDCDVLAFDVASFLQPLAECGREMCERARRGGAEEPNHGHRFLRAHFERPCRRAATNERDELSPFQLIELHFAPASAALHDSELGGISQPLG